MADSHAVAEASPVSPTVVAALGGLTTQHQQAGSSSGGSVAGDFVQVQPGDASPGGGGAGAAASGTQPVGTSSFAPQTPAGAAPSRRGVGDTEQAVLQQQLASATPGDQRAFVKRMEEAKRNVNYRNKFWLPPTESIEDDYSCAISKQILLHGRMYVSRGYICFYSKIFGQKTVEVVPFSEIKSIDRKNTAVFIPNAIEISTLAGEKHLFASFMFRDAAFDMLHQLWNESRSPSPAGTPPAAAANEFAHSSPPALQSGPGAPCASEPPRQPSVASPPLSERRATSPQPSDHDLQEYEQHDLLADDVESIMVQVAQCQFSGVSAEQLFSLLFSDATRFAAKFRQARGDNDFAPEPWGMDPQLGKLRVMRFRSPVKNAMGPNSTAINETQRVKFGARKASFTVESSSHMLDIPYGDNFNVVCKYDVSAELVCTVTVGVQWLKSTWFKRQIEAGVKTETEESYTEWARLAQQWVQTEAPSSAPAPALEAHAGPPVGAETAAASAVQTEKRTAASKPATVAAPAARDWTQTAILLALVFLVVCVVHLQRQVWALRGEIRAASTGKCEL